jgi:hypothetical protein
VSSSRKGARTKEFITAMRAALGLDPVRHEGEFHRIAPSQVNPKPVQAHIPVLLAATSPALERELIDHCREHLAHYKCPRPVDFCADLPRHPRLYKRPLRDEYRGVVIT